MISYRKLAVQYTVRFRHACMLGAMLMWSSLFLASLPTEAQARGSMQSAARDLQDCSWNRPGADPFMGDVVAAVDRYTDIAPAVREQLKQRMRARQYDEIVVITRDAIRGKQQYNARINQMHFGQGRVCRNVTRAGWSSKMEERGLVYCVQGECILVPTICRNVSRISQAGSGAPAGAGGTGGSAMPGGNAAPGGATSAGVVTIGGPEEGPPMWDNPDALRGGMSTGGALPPTVTYHPSTSYDTVRSASNTPGLYSGGGSGGSGGGGYPPRATDGSSFVDIHPVVPGLPGNNPVILPAVPEPQTWAMLLAGLALIGYSALRRRKQR